METNQKVGSFGLISIIIAIAAVALLGGVGLYFRETQKQKSLESVGIEAQKQTEALKQKATSEIDTSGWKTYHNEKYGFEVKYPDNYYLAPDVGKSEMDPLKSLLFAADINLPNSMPFNILVEVYDNAEGLSADEWFYKYMWELRFAATDATATASSLDNIPARVFSTKLNGKIGIFTLRQGKVYTIQWLGYNPDGSEYLIFQNIVRSFKFSG